MKKGSRQRDAIRQVLVSSGRPLSIGEIFKLAQRKVAGLGIATVYRNLKALQSEEQIAQVDLPGEPPRWELVPEGHHHHFLCETCNKLFEVQDCPRDLERILPEGYLLERHDILLRGQCGSCTGKVSARGK